MRRSFRTLVAEGSFEFGFRHPDTLDICPPNAKQLRAMPWRRPDGSLEWGADWLFYGGAAGGGKTAWLAYICVLYCLTYARVQAAIFRRTFKDLERSVIIELLQIIQPGLAIFNRELMRFEFANGSLLWLCYCQHENEVIQYQSFQVGLLAIDEASHFTEYITKYLISRLRSPRAGVPKLLRLGSNPGGVGHGWLKRWFIRPRVEETGPRSMPVPFEVWRPLPPARAKGRVRPDEVPTRQFIPARFEDNVILQQVNPQYIANLYQLEGDLAAQLAEGDWDANEAMIVGSVWQETKLVTAADTALLASGFRVGQLIPWHVIPSPTWRPPHTAKVYGSVDYGYGAPWSFHLHAALIGGHTRTWHERYKARVRDVQQAEQIRDDILRFEREGVPKPEWLVLDPSMWNSRQEMGLAKSIAEVYNDVINPTDGRSLNVPLRPGAAGRGARVSRPNRWLDALSTAPDGLPWHTFTSACPEAIRTVPEVPWDPDDPDVEDDESEQHAYEDIGRFFEARPHAPRYKPVDAELAALDPLSRAEAERTASRYAARKVPKGGVVGFGGRR